MIKMPELRNIAKELGVKTSRINKGDLIRQIQMAEGNFPCFSTADAGECEQQECLWLKECLSTATVARV